MKPFLPICLFLLAAGPWGLAQPAIPVDQSAWRDAAFLGRFLQSYGVRGEIEPAISRNEENVLQQVAAAMREDRLAEALTRLETTLRPDSNAALYFVAGNLHFQKGHHAAAAERYAEALDRFPDFLRAHQNRALATLYAGDDEQALAHLREVYRLGGREPQTYGLLGFVLQQRGSYASAENAYRMALLLEPEERPWRIGLAQALLAQDRDAEAAGLLAELRQQEPLDANILGLSANLALRSEDPWQAAPYLEMLRRLDSPDRLTLLTLADLYLNEEMPSLALPLYHEALSREPGEAAAGVLRAARMLLRRDDPETAADLKEKVAAASASLNPSDQFTLRLLTAELTRATGEATDALAQFRALAQEAPREGEVLIPFAELLAGSDRETEAALVWAQARAVPDHRTRIQANLSEARFLAAARRYGEALERMDAALALEDRPAWRSYRETLATLHNE